MYEPCPVCHGLKRIKQRTKISDGYRETHLICWACRGSGYVNYQEGEEVCDKTIERMFDALGV